MDREYIVPGMRSYPALAATLVGVNQVQLFSPNPLVNLSFHAEALNSVSNLPPSNGAWVLGITTFQKEIVLLSPDQQGLTSIIREINSVHRDDLGWQNENYAQVEHSVAIFQFKRNPWTSKA